jgi:Protein of unknown function DUF262
MEENEDVEEELGNEDVPIKIPFDPNKIKVRLIPYSIGQLVEDIKDGVINLETEFQRLPNLWNNQQKSRLIESVILSLPIPAFYFYEKEDNYWEVIDGLQRISTLKHFMVDKTFVLKNLEFLKEFEGFNYEKLPNTLQKRIGRFNITVYLIENGTPEDVKFNLFRRVNTAGLTLSSQEIRHALNQGLPAELVADLARGSDILNEDGVIRTRTSSNGTNVLLTATEEGIAFAKATNNKIVSTRMEDRDFITRFIAFYLIPYSEYQPDLDTFLNKALGEVKEQNGEQIKQLKSDFKAAMTLAFEIFGLDAFRKRLRTEDSKKPINKALFEVLSVNFAKLSSENRDKLRNKSILFKEKFIELNNNDKFYGSITQGTAQKESVTKRFTDIERIIREVLENDRPNTSN